MIENLSNIQSNMLDSCILKVFSEGNGKKEKGTGFFISQSGYILTAYHVISDNETDDFMPIIVGIYGGLELELEIYPTVLTEKNKEICRTNDFVVLKTKDGHTLPYIPICLLKPFFKRGALVYSKGYQLEKNKFIGFPSEYKIIGSTTRLGRDYIVMEGGVLDDGMSGSPILNIESKYPEIIGICVAESKSTDKINIIRRAKAKGKSTHFFKMPISRYSLGVSIFNLSDLFPEIFDINEKSFKQSLKAIKPEMIQYEGGKFKYGSSPYNANLQTINIKSFKIDKYPVTHLQYKMHINSHKIPEGKENYPVTGISYKQAALYAEIIGKRLPSDEEWEYAALKSGYSSKIIYNGNRLYLNEKFGNVASNNCPTDTTPVFKYDEVLDKTLGFNYNRCYDMIGNSYEWTKGQNGGVLRGGSYRETTEANYYNKIENIQDNDLKYKVVGFRCAK